MSIKLVVPPSALAVDLAEAKEHLRVDAADEDGLITSYIRAAAKACEHEIGRALITQQWEAVFDAFPAYAIRLDRPPVQAIVSVSYIDAAGQTQQVQPSAYVLDADQLPGYLLPAAGTSWPATANTANAVRVRFRTGYGDSAAAIPENLKLWMLLHIGAAYRQREAFAVGVSVAEMPARFHDALLDSERVY